MQYLRPGFVCRPPLLVAWNPQDKSALINLSGGNLVAASISAGDGGVRGTKVRAAGKWYFEVNMQTVTGGNTGAGLTTASEALTDIGPNVTNSLFQFKSGNVYKNTGFQFGNGNMSAGGILQVAYDGTAHLAWLKFQSGNWNNNGSADPGTGVGGLDVSAFDSAGLFPAFTSGGTGDQCTGNFGASSFSFSKPTGFSSWNFS